MSESSNGFLSFAISFLSLAFSSLSFLFSSSNAVIFCWVDFFDSSYALLENNTFPQYPYFEYNQKSKFYQTKLIKIDENSNISIIKPFIPFSHLHNYFVPNFEEFATIEDGDSPSRCGFTIIPYKVVQDIDGIANTDIGAYHIPFSWHSTSFNRTSDSSTYRYVVNSTSYYPVYLQKPNLPDLEL